MSFLITSALPRPRLSATSRTVAPDAILVASGSGASLSGLTGALRAAAAAAGLRGAAAGDEGAASAACARGGTPASRSRPACACGRRPRRQQGRRRLHAGPRHPTARSSRAPNPSPPVGVAFLPSAFGAGAAGFASAAAPPAPPPEGLERIGFLDARRGDLRLDSGRVEGREHLLAAQPLILRDLMDALLRHPRDGSPRNPRPRPWVPRMGSLPPWRSPQRARRPRSRRPRPGPPRARRRRVRLGGSLGLGRPPRLVCLALRGLLGLLGCCSASASASALGLLELLRGRLGLGGLLLALLRLERGGGALDERPHLSVVGVRVGEHRDLRV